MRRRMTANFGVTLTELMLAVTISGIVMLIGWSTWEMGWRETRSAQTRMASSRDACSVLHIITKEVLCAQQIDIPDPDYVTKDSIQLHVVTPTGIERRAFRRDARELILDLKDVDVAPYAVFDGVTKLEFTALGEPEDGVVKIVCATRQGDRKVQMRTVVKKRN